MGKLSSILCTLIIGFGLAACSAVETDEREGPVAEEGPSGEADQERDEADMTTQLTMKLTIGDEVFLAKLYENETTEALVKLLPLSIKMEDLHGNEKFYYLSEELPTDSKKPDIIEAGDIMLYGDNCLVLFYGKNTTSYEYTRLGSIGDVEKFTQAVGDGDVTMTIDLAVNQEN